MIFLILIQLGREQGTPIVYSGFIDAMWTSFDIVENLCYKEPIYEHPLTNSQI